jgi:uncharacterized protein with PIN domain
VTTALDGSALLALLFGEPDAETLADAVAAGCGQHGQPQSNIAAA